MPGDRLRSDVELRSPPGNRVARAAAKVTFTTMAKPGNLITALETLETKRVATPKRKHGNIPL